MSTDHKRPRGGHPYTSRYLKSRIERTNQAIHGHERDEAEDVETEFPELNSVRYKGSDIQEDTRPLRETKRTVRPAYWNHKD